jgi:hypothetical protein
MSFLLSLLGIVSRHYTIACANGFDEEEPELSERGG